jgi:hypothetical protein
MKSRNSYCSLYNMLPPRLLPKHISFFSSCSTLGHRADFSVSWSLTDGRTPWTGDQLVARPLPKHRTTQTHKKKTHAHIKHPCPESDSNPRSRLPNELRQYMPQVAWLPWPAYMIKVVKLIYHCECSMPVPEARISVASQIITNSGEQIGPKLRRKELCD